VVYYLVLGACGIQESDVRIKGTAANCVALASAIIVGIALQDFYRTVEADD